MFSTFIRFSKAQFSLNAPQFVSFDKFRYLLFIFSKLIYKYFMYIMCIVYVHLQHRAVVRFPQDLAAEFILQ